MSHTFTSGTIYKLPWTENVPGTIIVQKDAYVLPVSATAIFLNQGPWTITVDGTVTGDNNGDGIGLSSSISIKNSTITVGLEGTVSANGGGGSAIYVSQAVDITNSGVIHGQNSGIVFDNNITALHHVSVTNNAAGVISGDQYGIIDFSPGAVTIKNAGVIVGVTDAIDVTLGTATITNSGKIYGDVVLFGGNDKLTDSGTGAIVGNIHLGAGDDSFTGGNAAETVFDGIGHDSYKLGGGNDHYWAKSGGGMAGDLIDTVDGGAGFDTFDASDSLGFIKINLDTKLFNDGTVMMQAKTAAGTDIGQDTVTGFEFVIGSNLGDDYIIGGNAAETLGGLGGADHIYGGGGRDFLFGDAGNDFLYGGAGADTLTGGPGDDHFVFLDLKDSGTTRATRDTISDFVQGHDVIDLSLMDILPQTGIQNFFHLEPVVNSDFNGSSGQLRFLSAGTQTIIEGDANGDGKADFSIALDGNYTFTTFDFLL